MTRIERGAVMDVQATSANMLRGADPMLTVVTINRNNQADLKRTLESFRPLKDDERLDWIFVDGASTDGSLELARGFYPAHQIVSEPDRGIYDAMNKGLWMASGRFVLWINSGDELITETITDVLPRLAHLDCDVFCGAVEILDVAGVMERVFVPDPGYLPRGMVAHSSTIYRTQTVREHGGYPLKYPVLADRYLTMKLYISGRKFVFDQDVISRFYLGGISTVRNHEYENLRIDYELGLMNFGRYLWHRVRIALGVKPFSSGFLVAKRFRAG